MIKILTSIPNPRDATSFYRVLSPLGDLRKKMEVDFSFSTDYFWGAFRINDIFFSQRPQTLEHLYALKQAKRCGIPTWVDYDDDVLNVPLCNHVHYVYEEDKENIKESLKIADFVTVSTNKLKTKFSAYTKNEPIVIPNALDLELVGRPKLKNRSNRILWRGSKSHEKDVMLYLSEIVSLINATPNHEWYFLGDVTWMWKIRERVGKNAFFLPNKDILDYFDTITDLAPIVTIVPLENNEFNRCKSNINWIEATYAGSLTIAPQWEEWNKPGVIHYDSNESFYNQIISVLNWTKDYSVNYKESNQYIVENLLLTDVNKARVDLIHKLLNL